jgi:hypothetical protein
MWAMAMAWLQGLLLKTSLACNIISKACDGNNSRPCHHAIAHILTLRTWEFFCNFDQHTNKYETEHGQAKETHPLFIIDDCVAFYVMLLPN